MDVIFDFNVPALLAILCNSYLSQQQRGTKKHQEKDPRDDDQVMNDDGSRIFKIVDLTADEQEIDDENDQNVMEKVDYSQTTQQ